MQLTEQEIKSICIHARDVFMQQPILLELEAPIKICGTLSGPTRTYTCKRARVCGVARRWQSTTYAAVAGVVCDRGGGGGGGGTR